MELAEARINHQIGEIFYTYRIKVKIKIKHLIYSEINNIKFYLLNLVVDA